MARFGGEEFVVLLPDTDERGTLVVGEKLRALLAAMVVPAVMNRRMTASLGAASLRADDLTTATVLQRVDVALYQAKAAGRNRVVTSEPCHPAALVPESAARSERIESGAINRSH